MDVIPVGPSPPFSFGTERNPFGGFCRKSSGPRVRPSPTSKPPREQRTLKRYETLGLLIASLLPPEQVVNSEPRRPLPSALLAPRSQRTSLSLPAPPLGPGPGRRSWHRGAQGQEGILRCHPDLAGRELQQGTLTAESRREQRGAGLMSLDAAERLRLAELNAQYRARFGFPFVLAARLSDRAAVPGELARRLQRPPAEELRTALGEVKKIGRLRLADLLGAAGLAGP
ncbi:putative 2-oxo-4-hydroxy-4-carboxy-5-ureidoimidazoline decarboxylase isoform X1 [Acinonyx jubatus]|uniref:2-oxo-4-hydroxy-4-carboxy-5-ureidoimidazoline decarboxylase n=1 Tax=Acinonyx jubatus TaxID=32536 RepID=A0ABM3P7L1_ACIJB|nr:putative 2-oxo-4-hydroxy-4-carboxy-5-ureidoimidazoline decarboxylase isoform X1 [Acinonyx jubatus]